MLKPWETRTKVYFPIGNTAIGQQHHEAHLLSGPFFAELDHLIYLENRLKPYVAADYRNAFDANHLSALVKLIRRRSRSSTP
jgi:hypothetical protein